MAIDLANYEVKAREAVQAFWGNREKARQKQIDAGKADQASAPALPPARTWTALSRWSSTSCAPTASTMQTFTAVAALSCLPGYFRPTKLWDLLVINEGRLIAALEFKSQVGPSFGNNFNNRTEEAIGTAHDLWTAYREGAFGKQPRPFVGWMMMVEDAPESRQARHRSVAALSDVPGVCRALLTRSVTTCFASASCRSSSIRRRPSSPLHVRPSMTAPMPNSMT